MEVSKLIPISIDDQYDGPRIDVRDHRAVYGYIARLVKRGALLLDTYHGSKAWAVWIETGTLDMRSEKSDVLGQIFGESRKGFETVVQPLAEGVMHRSDVYGFSLPDWLQTNRNFAWLTRAWVVEIERRRTIEIGQATEDEG